MDLPPVRLGYARIRIDIASRLKSIRLESFGEAGTPALAARLGLPPQSWANYEAGVSIPGEILLRFIEITGVDPLWLLRGVAIFGTDGEAA